MFKFEVLSAVRRCLPIAAFVALAMTATSSQAAGTVVNVSLWDQGLEAPMATDLGFPAVGKDLSKATMGIAVSQDTVKAGQVTFEVLNSSEDLVHEMLITKLRDLSQIFPYDAQSQRLNEDEMPGILGEVAEIEPGQTGALRLNLAPGNYLLFCNIAGHFAGGMWTVFSVTP